MKAILKQTNKKILSQDPNHQWEIDTIGPIHLAWGKKKSKPEMLRFKSNPKQQNGKNKVINNFFIKLSASTCIE